MAVLTNFFKVLPDFKGKRRLAKWLLSGFIERSKDIVLSVENDMKFKVPNLKETVSFEMLVNGIYEKETSDFIVRRLPSKAIFFDIGANIGAIAFVVCKKRKDVTALCIEASPRVFDYLKFNRELNECNNTVIINNAIGASSGQVVSFFSPEEQFGKGSLSAVFTQQAEHVTTVTIDELVVGNNYPKIDFIKIDVEGYGYHAFKGGENVLKGSDAPEILFEFVDWAEELAADIKPGDAQRLLKSYGYKIYEFVNDSWIEKAEAIIRGSAMLFATKKGIDAKGN